MELIEQLPCSSVREADDIPASLIGATIVRIGTFPFPESFKYQGGGLGIDYRPAGSRELRRIILEFDEREMHIHSDTTLSKMG